MKLLLLISLAAAGMLAAESASGTWMVEGSVAGYPLKEECTLKQDGAKLTGSCKGDAQAEDVSGEVAGDKITFHHGGDYQGTPLTVTYTATLAADGTLKGEVSVAPFDASGEFTAKKKQ